MYSIVIANTCTVIDKMLALGASQQVISSKWAVQSILEIPTYFLGAKLLLRYNHYTLLQFSSFLLSLQFFLFAIVQDANQMVLLSVFQIGTTPVILLTSKTLIFKLSKPKVRGSSQLIALSIFTGVSTLLVPAIAGSSSLYIGMDITLFVFACLGVLSCILIVYLRKIAVV